MNIVGPPKVVLLGFLSHFPVAGVAWQTVHYLLGFQKLGCDVYYVEAHGCTPSKLMRSDTDDGPARAAAYIAEILGRFGLQDRWAYHALYESRYFGLSETQLKELYRSAALIINLHGGHLPTPELTATNRLVYVETDPVDVEIDLYHKKQETLDYLKPHCAFFTYGENLGRADCRVPAPEPFRFMPTRQPVIMDLWSQCDGGPGDAFTTIGNWRQPWREFTFQGEVYRWSKHFEFHKFLELPQRVAQPFELALSSYNQEDKQLLETKGWRVRDALELSQDLDIYQKYVSASRGEFTVAKDQNVRLRSGWFSDRAATYLAAGRPVITQETGFSNHLPAGEGLFAFSTMEEIIAAVEKINTDYSRQRRAAREVAHNYFSHAVVLGAMLQELGISQRNGLPRNSKRSDNESSDSLNALNSLGDSALPRDLWLTPISRWPTRLPEQTLQTAQALGLPSTKTEIPAFGRRASIIIVTHNGLPYTKMCLASLLAHGWRSGDELILVDNASTDGTREYLRQLSASRAGVKVVCNAENRGFAAANNQGLAEATGDVLILLNNDTLVPLGWRDGLVRWLGDPAIGMVGPVTNRTCNEAQIDAPYRTYNELEQFARSYTQAHASECNDIRMLAMFCVAFRRDVLAKVGPLDEQFAVGMFEDDDYALRVRQAGYRVVCIEDVFIHHFGQGSFGELCVAGEYDRILSANRQRFETKWGITWQPHGRRQSPAYLRLRERIQHTASERLPTGSTVAVISKGDEELVKFARQQGWHFPQAADGGYANIYPARGDEAVAHLEAMRAKGAQFLLIPKPAFWWLEHYGEFKTHLERHCRLAVREEETCLIFDLGGEHA